MQFNKNKPNWLTANQKYYPALIKDRKRLKKSMTDAEQLLWYELKSKKLGVKFRRQHVIGSFIVDFVCLPAKLVIEVDGGIHQKQISYDKMREEKLKLLGYKILRFTNKEIFEDIFSICDKIRDSVF